MQQPAKVSVVIPTKDRADLLGQTLASVVGQSYGVWEVLVVDDGSTDETAAQLRHLTAAEPRIRYLRRSGALAGANACRNEGVAAATGDYVIFLDSDDCLAPFCLAQRVAAMQAHPTLDFGVFPCRLFREEPGDTNILWNADTEENDLDRYLKKDVPWQTSGPIWTRAALQKLGPWDEALPSWQDWDFHVRALMLGLTYKKFGRPDFFWRTSTGRETVNRKAGLERHQVAHEQLFAKVRRMLEEKGLLTQERGRLLAGLYFRLAKRWAKRGKLGQALRAWAACERLVDAATHREGRVFLRTYTMVRRIPYVREGLQKLLASRWPQDLIVPRSKTMTSVPPTHGEVGTTPGG